MLALDIAHLLELLEVLADGDFGYVEKTGQLLDLGVAVFADQVKDFGPPLIKCHSIDSSLTQNYGFFLLLLTFLY